MKVLCLIAVVLVGLAHSVPAPGCRVGEWGEWESCKNPKGACRKSQSVSGDMTDEQKKLGEGRTNMEFMMKRKNELWRLRQACLEEGTCPHLQPRPSQRFTACVDGMAGEYPCDNIDMLSFINFADLGFPELAVGGNDIWVWHDTENGEDYVIMGTTHGSSFVRITDPQNPEVIGILRTHTTPSNWRDMKVVGNHAYIVSEANGHGMQVFDLTQLRGRPADPSHEFENTAHMNNFGQAHNIAANPAEQRVYVIGSTDANDCDVGVVCDGACDGGLHVVDVSNPLQPAFVTCNGIDGYVHDTECMVYDGPDTRYTGADICFGYNENSLTVYNADEEQLLSRKNYTGSRYTHQGWATENRFILLLDDELDEYFGSDKQTKTYIWNIEDLENPILLHTHYSMEESIDHNQYIIGDLTYQSNYESGLRVLEIDELAPSLTQRAYFDVYPSRTTADFQGTWSNYPWLNNNVVAVSSIDYGLFLLQLNIEAVEAQKQSDVTMGEQHRYRAALPGSDITACPPLVERRVCVPEEC